MQIRLALSPLLLASAAAARASPAQRLFSSNQQHLAKMADNFNPAEAIERDNLVYPRVNVFGEALQPVPNGLGPVTGFFRNNYCDASPLDPGSHTVAAIVTPTFLKFSAERGNDLRSLFPESGALAPKEISAEYPAGNPHTTWGLCASRWAEALRHSGEHPAGEAIVPRVVLEATHERALADGGIDMADLQRFAVGGSANDAAREDKRQEKRKVERENR